MALHWDISNCKNFEALQEEENGEWAITNALIWGTMSVDIGTIKPKNIADFYARVKVIELFGTLVTKYDDQKDESNPYPLSFGDIEKRIGLSTNVSTVTPNQWLKRIETFNANSRNNHYAVSGNKIKATYYSALAEIESYTTTTEKGE